MIRVLNKKKHGDAGEYVGRPSVLGNPFVIGANGTRKEVIEKYRIWLNEQWQSGGQVKGEILRLVTKYQQNGVLDLVCWCAPAPCHAEVIAKAVKKLASSVNSQ